MPQREERIHQPEATREKGDAQNRCYVMVSRVFYHLLRLVWQPTNEEVASHPARTGTRGILEVEQSSGHS